MSVVNAIPLIAAGDDGYSISRSLRFRSSATAYLSRTPASAGSSTTWTWSGWIKRGALGVGGGIFSAGAFSTSSDITGLQFRTDDTIQIFQNNGATTVLNKITTQVFRDPSAWYHIVLTFDTTNATAEDRVRLYVNGNRITVFSANTNISLNGTTYVNSTSYANRIGRSWTTDYLDHYITEVNFIDGQALTPSSFGAFSIYNQWLPKKYAGSYGTNGFYLPFTNNASTTTLGYDFSPQGNNWTTNNISVTAGITYDSMLDVPTMYADGGNGRGNYSVINPLDSRGTNTVSNGNLTYVTGTTFNLNRGTIAMTSGKWYWEVTSFSGIPGVGVSRTDVAVTNAGHDSANGWAYFGDTGNKWNNNSGAAYGASYGTTDVIGVALDMDAGTLAFYKNGTSQGTAFSTGLAGQSLAPMLTSGLGASGGTFNFGQRPFTYTPPTGYLALNTFNL